MFKMCLKYYKNSMSGIIHTMKGWSTEIWRIIPSLSLSCVLKSRSFTEEYNIFAYHIFLSCSGFSTCVVNLHSESRLTGAVDCSSL